MSPLFLQRFLERLGVTKDRGVRKDSVSAVFRLLLFLLVFPHGYGCIPSEDFTITISHYDPDQAYDGYTYFETYFNYPGYFCVDMEGRVLWRRDVQVGIFGDSAGLGLAADGNVLALPGNRPTVFNPVWDTVLWEWNDHRDAAHHSISMTSRGTILFLEREEGIPVEDSPWPNCEIVGDAIKEVDLGTHEVVWEWKLHDHVNPVEHHFEGMCSGQGLDPIYWGDWSHCNSVKFYPDVLLDGALHDVVLLNSRHLDTFWLIDHATSEILWSCGRHGDVGGDEPTEWELFSQAHEVDMLADGNFILFDNGRFRTPEVSRALEISVDTEQGTAVAVWSWTESPDVMYSAGMGDADRLPNGNTLVTDVLNGRIIEVNPEGEKVWQMTLEHPLAQTWIYQFKRTRPWTPCPDADGDGYGDPAVRGSPACEVLREDGTSPSLTGS